jgi:hypothetical protein
MDKLEFTIENKSNDDNSYRIANILINGSNLIDMLKVYEIPFAKNEGSESIAGGYEGLLPEILHQHLTNPNKSDDDESDKISILECVCGVDGCWPMLLKITYSDTTIVWHEFEQLHRSNESHKFWDYSNFGPFTFDLGNYNDQLTKLK